MPLQYIVPRVAIDESNVGPRPTPGVSLATIGVVGTFAKGPVNKPTTIGSLDQFISTFGLLRTDLTGPLTMTGAMNQGATDFVVNRIVGAGAAPATLTLKDGATTPADSIVVTANSPGIWANGTEATGVKIAVTDGTTANTAKIIVIVGSKSRTYDNLSLDDIPKISDPDVTFEKQQGPPLFQLRLVPLRLQTEMTVLHRLTRIISALLMSMETAPD